MPSDNKTPNIGLNQWKGNEYPKREDFVNDNSIIDTELKDIQDKIQNVTIGEENKPAYEYLTVGTRGTGVVGTNSFTSGADNIALGADSQAEGWLTKATADQSHAEGQGTKASGNAAHSEGRGTTASGDYSHVEGENNAAIGRGSHAEGYLTAAIAPNSHAEGTAAYALEASHAEGYLSFAGYGTLYKITAFNNANKTITLDKVTGLAVGDKLQIIREDHQSTVVFDVLITAISGLVVTLNTTVTIISAWKYVIKAGVGGYPAHAEGRLTIAVGYDSHAEGYKSQSQGAWSHAEGNGTIASGPGSHAEGGVTLAEGDWSHAEGQYARSYGVGSHAEGAGDIINYNKAYGAGSHVEGYNTTAGKPTDNFATIIASHAEGNTTVASGRCAHAEGVGTKAAGEFSHAEGHDTEANGHRSHSAGLGTIANGNEQTVLGRYNIPDSSALLLIGNGTSDAARSTAMAVLADGTIRHAGHIYGAIKTEYITMASGFTMADSCVTDRSGYHVELQLYATGTIPAYTWTHIGTIPNTIDRPIRTVRGLCTGNTEMAGALVVHTDGIISVQFKSAQSSFAANIGYFAPYH